MNRKHPTLNTLHQLALGLVAAVGILSIIATTGGDGDGLIIAREPIAREPPAPVPTVPDVENQLANVQEHGDGLAFRLGVGNDPDLWTDFGYGPCKHYQGLARMDINGVPYFFLTRSGTHTGACPSPTVTDNPGELLVVRMGSRDAHGKRLRSNRLARDRTMDNTLPPDADAGVKSILFYGQTDEDGNVWPSYLHPAAIQGIDGVLAIPLDQYCDSSNWIPNPSLPQFPGPEAYHCTDIDNQTSSVLLVDVSDPDNPKPLYEFLTPEKAHGAAVTRDPDSGKYLFALNVGTEELLFYESNATDLRDPALQIEQIDTWSRSELPSWDQIEWYEYQSLNFVRQSDGALYLIGGDNNSSSEPTIRGDDFAWLFKVYRTGEGQQSEFTLLFQRQKHIETEQPQMGNFKAGGAAYVSPRGELILYTAHHDPNETDGVMRVAMGEFRHIDVTHDGTLEMTDVDGDGQLEDSCSGWVELYEAAYGWNEYRSLMFDFRDRHLDNWENLSVHENFNDKTSAVRWNLPEGQKAWFYEAANFELRRIELTDHGVVEDMSQPFTVNGFEYTGWNDIISSVLFSPVADLGGPYEGPVNTPIHLDTANPCYKDDSSVMFSWEADSSSCVISNSAARRPTIDCSEAGVHKIKLTVTQRDIPNVGEVEASEVGTVTIN